MIRVLPACLLLALAAPAMAQETPSPAPETASAPPAAIPEVAPVVIVESAPATVIPEAIAEVPPPSLEDRVTELEKQLLATQVELLKARTDVPPKKDLEFDLDGYFRVRAYTFNHMFLSQEEDGEYRDARVMTQRLRLQPSIKYKDLAKFYAQIDGLDDVVWGDNESLASTSVFAGNPSPTDFTGQSSPTLKLSRAWMEATVPIGSIRAGRMSSAWGMGLLVNSGDGFDDTFGENHAGATFDRVMVATRPIAIGQKILGKDDTNIPLYAIFAVDRLVEDPLYQFYGYECERNLTEADADFDARCDSDGDGLTDQEHGFTDEGREDDDRGQDWWADQNDDVVEEVYALLYRGIDKQFLGAKGDLSVGGYIIHRTQRETESDVLISDAFVNVKNRGIHLEAEGVHIGGHTRGIVLAGALPSGAEGDPLYKQADIWGYVARLGYEQEKYALTFEHGYASGDENVTDEKFTGRPLNPDFNVGLLLYEEILARVTAQQWSDGAAGLWSNGGVYNSRYIFPNVHYYPRENWELEAAYLMVFPDKADGAIVLCKAGEDGCTGGGEASSLGWEIDVAAKIRWHEHLLFALEGGYARATDRLPLEASGLDPDGKYLTVQSRLAYEF